MALPNFGQMMSRVSQGSCGALEAANGSDCKQYDCSAAC